MYIDGNLIKAAPGDLVFLPSGVPHALKNTGTVQCEYFAFQWRN
jgi:mannose-6-phosphate isomerase-like protein (cupin superfamily)